MKILFVISSMGSGGAERVLSSLSNYFVEKFNWSIYIVTYSNVEDFYLLDKRIQRIKLNDPYPDTNSFYGVLNRISRIYNIRNTIKDIEPDVVMPLIVYTNIYTLLANIGLGNNIVVSEHNNYQKVESYFWKILRLLTYKIADKTVLLTNFDLRYYKKYLSNCVVIPNPIEIECDSKSIIREKIILSVGRLHEVKQFDHLIEIYSTVHKKYPDWKLLILGEGVERSRLTKLIEKYNLEDAITLGGLKKNISTFYRRASIYALTSKYEGFPMALCEAMKCGMAVVSYDCPSGPEEILLNDDQYGILIDANKKDQMVQAIMRLIADEELRKKIGDSAQERIEEFSLDNIANRWKVLLNTVKGDDYVEKIN